MSRSITSHFVGLCSECGGDFALNPSTDFVRAHSGDGGRTRCDGSGKFPSTIVDGRDVIPYDQWHNRIENDGELLLPLTMEERTEREIFLKELPVYSEDGLVVGRARVKPDRVILIGTKWREKRAG